MEKRHAFSVAETLMSTKLNIFLHLSPYPDSHKLNYLSEISLEGTKSEQEEE